jgi:hypothetical protein
VVGDQERIDVDLAQAVVTRLHAAGLELHQALRWAANPETIGHITSAMDKVDNAIRLVRRATAGLEDPEVDPPAS